MSSVAGRTLDLPLPSHQPAEGLTTEQPRSSGAIPSSSQPVGYQGQEQSNTRKITLRRRPTRTVSEASFHSGASLAVTRPPVHFVQVTFTDF